MNEVIKKKRKKKVVEEGKEEEFEEQEPLTAADIAADLSADPRPHEDYVLKIKGKPRRLVPASLRDIPKVGSIVQSITSGEDANDMSFFSEEKVDLVADLIYLSLSKSDKKEITKDDVLDSCGFADFPVALQACLSLNDFLTRMGQVRRTMESLL